MMRILAFLVVSLFLITSLGMGQTWNFDDVFYDFQLPQSNGWGLHGVAVAPDGNIWLALHGDLAQDSAVVGGVTYHYRPVYVLDPSGNHVSFSPIRNFGTDTLHAGSVHNGSGKGINVDNDGNILYTSWSTLYRINYQTGDMMNIYTPADMASMTEATQADDGKIFISWVSGSTKPILMLDDAFNLLGNAADTLGHLTRTLEVSGDGMDLYSGSTWNGFGVEKWHSDIPGLLQYTPVDTLGNWDSVYVASTDTTYYNVKLWASSLDWSPDGQLLAGNLRSDWSGPGAGMGSKWYFFDVATGDLVDEVGEPFPFDSSQGGVYSPRGAAWDATGDVMYLADFDYNMVSKWTRGAGYIEIDGEIVAKTFELQQNYPNPFNPVTKIPFKLLKNATVKLTVYNIEGQEVATLIDKDMNTGNHIYTYDASKLASGVYYYELNVESERLVKRMILVK